MRFILLLFLIHLTGCSNSTNENTICCGISATINLKNLPNEVTYGGGTDLVYSISFDINNSQTLDEGDLILKILYISWVGDSAVTIPSSNMEAYIWTVNPGNTITTRQARISLITTNTSLEFIAKDTDHPSIALINSGTQIFVRTTYTEPAQRYTYYDYFPAKDTFTSGLDTSYIEDAHDDIVSMDDQGLTHNYPQIDITSITVHRL